MEQEEKKQYEAIPRFIPEGCKNCKGHANVILDCDFTKKEDGNLLVQCINNYVDKK